MSPSDQVQLLHSLQTHFGPEISDMLKSCKSSVSEECFESVALVLFLYSKKCIEKVQVESFLDYSLSLNPNLKQQLHSLLINPLKSSQENQNLIEKIKLDNYIPVKKQLLNIKCSPSYRTIIKATHESLSQKVEPKILNDEYYSISENADENNATFFMTLRKNQFFQQLFMIEDQMYEISNTLELFKKFLAHLEIFSENESANNLSGENEKKMYDTSMVCLPKIVIKKLYDDDFDIVLKSYYQYPSKTVPVLISRLKQKIDNWISLSLDYKILWRTKLYVANKNLASHYYHSSKQNELKQIQPRILISPFLNQKKTLSFPSKAVFEDTINLICRFLRRQQISQREKSIIKFIIYHFVPELVGNFEGCMSDDDFENLSDDSEFKDLMGSVSQNYRKNTKYHASFVVGTKKSQSTMKKGIAILDDYWIIFLSILHILNEKMNLAYNYLSSEENYTVNRQASILNLGKNRHGKSYKKKMQNLDQGGKQLATQNLSSPKDEFIEALCEFMDGNIDERQYFEQIYNLFGMTSSRLCIIDKLIKCSFRQLVSILRESSSLFLMNLSDEDSLDSVQHNYNANFYKVYKQPGRLLKISLIKNEFNSNSKSPQDHYLAKLNPLMSPEGFSSYRVRNEMTYVSSNFLHRNVRMCSNQTGAKDSNYLVLNDSLLLNSSLKAGNKLSNKYHHFSSYFMVRKKPQKKFLKNKLKIRSLSNIFNEN